MNPESNNTTLEEMFATIDSVYAAHPEVVLVTKEQSSETVASTPQQVKTITTLNLTKAVQQHLDDLRPTTALTRYEVKSLSEEEIQVLKPVQERTIIELLSLTFGKNCSPVMLNGTLLAHTADGQYIKIVPEIDKNGYANYKFTAINYKALNCLIDKYCELLHKTSAYEGIYDYDYDYGDDDDDTEDAIDITDVDSIFGTNTSVKATTTTKAKSITDDDDYDAYTLKTLNFMLKARMQSSQKHLNLQLLSERLDSQVRLYAEDMELLEYLQVVTKRVYKELERPWHIPYTEYYDTLRISGHYLSAWIYFPEEYNAKINNPPLDDKGKIIKYTVDHIQQGIEYRSDNRPENLSIELESCNKGRTRRSIPVSYNGHNYVSLSTYCSSTGAGNPDNIEDLKNSLQPGKTKEYKGRTYTLGESKRLIVTDAKAKAPEISFNGTLYPTLADFAKAVKLIPDTVHKAVSRAKKAGKTEFEHKFKNKKYQFYLDENGNTIITL